MFFASYFMNSPLSGIQLDLGLEFLPNLLLAVILGAALGYERRRRQKVAGLRTLMVISLASCVLTLCGVKASVGVTHADPTRVAGQILSGIGFLGAGVILRQGFITSGVTTAATILLVTGVGMACGFGQYSLAISVTLVDLLALLITTKYIKGSGQRSELSNDNSPIKFSCRPEEFAGIRALLGDDYKLISVMRKDDLLKVTVGTSLSPEQREKVLDRIVSTPELLALETTIRD
ncbi:MAG: MgtC/SapB family protein [Candidatus Obscuribacterales bacterium]|nr:MgtC/SapB family protein [Candidatus Obscuribacterales bacterium]